MTREFPHHQAAFINAIADEGTKAEAIHFLQETWNELCELKKKHQEEPELKNLRTENERLREALETAIDLLEVSLKGQRGAFVNAVFEEDLPRLKQALQSKEGAHE